MVTVMLRTVQQTMENVWGHIFATAAALNFDLKYLTSRDLINNLFSTYKIIGARSRLSPQCWGGNIATISNHSETGRNNNAICSKSKKKQL